MFPPATGDAAPVAPQSSILLFAALFGTCTSYESDSIGVAGIMVSGSQASPVPPGVVVILRCPACRQHGTFDNFGPQSTDLALNGGQRAGLRRCPNPSCATLVHFVSDGDGRLVVTYPAERIDFEATSIPTAVASALEEAITCHAASCYVAAGIMVRKALEELCHERGAQGGSLKDRIRALGTKVILPQELLEGLDDLRLLGNDAAHIESQVFNQVGKEEVEVGIDFAKEVLKATYQYAALLSRLRALKRT